MAVEDGEIPAHGGADGADNFGGKAQALGERSAVAVGAAVGECGHGLFEQVAAGPVDFHGVEPGGLGAQGGLGPRIREAGELGLIKGDGVVGLKHARNDAHDPAGHVGIFGMRAAPAVLELDGDGGPVGVDAFREQAQAGDETVIADVQPVQESLAGNVDGGGLHDDQPHAAFGPLLIIGEQPFRHIAAVHGHVGHHPRQDETVPDRQGMDVHGGQ